MKPFLLFGIILISISIQAQVTQEWVRTFSSPFNGLDYGKFIERDNAGNIYVSGYSDGGSTGSDIVTIKYNPAGEEQWVQIFDANYVDIVNDMVIDNLGNIYLTGYTAGDTSGYDYLTIKYNSNGAQLWVKYFNGPTSGNDIASSLIVDNFGSLIVTGRSAPVSGGDKTDIVTIKYDNNGNQIWLNRYNGPDDSYDSGNAVGTDQLGNIYVIGYSYYLTTKEDIIIIKYDASGVQQWQKIYSGTTGGTDNSVDMILDTLGNIYVTGYSPGGSSGNADIILLKYNYSGIFLWEGRYNGPSDLKDYPQAMALGTNQNIYITGYSNGINTNDDDYVTLMFNPQGNIQWVQRYAGPVGSDRSKDIALDGTSNVYITGSSVGLGTSSDFLTIKYSSTGEQKWVERYTDPLPSSQDGGYGILVDDSENIFLTGQSKANFITIKYSQGLNIIEPRAGEKWIAGETDTIRWTGGQPGQFVSIEYSTDNGQTYNLIELSAPADSQYYVWNIPSTLLSTSSKIKLTDLQTSTELAVSDSFKVKGYVLTRLDENGQYVAFSSALHGWQYTNGTLWPSTWWSQFNYSTATDPYTNELYPSFFHPIPASSFIDWPLFVEVFGVDQCYYWTSAPLLGANYKGDAQNKWRGRVKTHNGSCFGFAASSFLAFNFRDQFFQKHQGIPNVDNIFNLNLTNTIQKTINGYWAYQLVKQSLDNDVTGIVKDPRTTLIEVMNMFKNDVTDVRTITIFRTPPPGQLGGAHTMAPISVTVDNTGPSRYRVNLYDSNNPGVNTPYILVDSLNNTWQDFTGLGAGWNGTNKFYLEIPVSNYLNTPILSKMKSDNSNGINNIEFYNTEKADIIYTSSTGEKIGIVDGNLIDEIDDGISIINKNGKPSDPIGYYIPDDTYSVVMNNISDSSDRAFISVFKEDVIYNYERVNVNVSQSDKFRIDEGFSVVSQDLEDKQINLSVIAKLDSSERILFVQQTQLKQNDSLYLRETNQSEFIMKNYGTSKTYKLEINERSSQEQEIFQNLSISLQENSSHIIQPNWADLDGSILNILVDIGNNGTIDDTLSIVNQVTGIGDDQGTLLTPNSYNLAQNFPNPFNPTTTIQYSIPQRSNVTLKVYDVLGNEVATLVNEEKIQGVYSITFDARNLSSGIYFYKLQSGSFVETKKMILIK